MGQYYNVVNLTKKEFLNPYKFGDGLKLMEFSLSTCGTMTALAILLSNGNGLGGGDLESDNPIIGSWAGDNIVIIGDYAEKDQYGFEGSIYSLCEEFDDVSEKVLDAMLDDDYVSHILEKERKQTYEGSPYAIAYDSVIKGLENE